MVDGLTGSIGMLAGLGATPEEGEVEERKESPSGGEEKDEEDGAMLSRPDSRSSIVTRPSLSSLARRYKLSSTRTLG